MKRFFTLTAAGTAGYIIAFPPLDFGLAGIPALTLLGLAFHEQPGGKCAWLWTYVMGLALFTLGCAWIGGVTVSSLLLMAVFEGLALPLFALLFRRMTLRAGWRVPIWLALPPNRPSTSRTDS